MATSRLLHLRLKSPTSYHYASDIQSRLQRLHLDAKLSPQSSPPPPPPLFLTAQFHPIYTLGRRDLLKPSQEESLPAPIHRTNRGGQITFHGPGQCVGYLVCDLRRHSIRTRDFVRTLESAAISVMASRGLKSFTTKEPGVWVAEDRKIASVGVALRRFVSTHGIAVNVSTDLSFFDSITACGLEGVKATSMDEEGYPAEVEDVATGMAETLAVKLQGVDGVQEVEEEEVLSWISATEAIDVD